MSIPPALKVENVKLIIKIFSNRISENRFDNIHINQTDMTDGAYRNSRRRLSYLFMKTSCEPYLNIML